jgi:Mrp family chromosome partitioning ATPase
MTRIFDALRKSQSVSAPEPVAPAPFTPARSAPAPAPAWRPTSSLPSVVPFPGDVALPDETLQEMSLLRVNLESAMGDKLPRVVMFASSQGGEGTTSVLLQFGLTLARDPERQVLLVDVHARRPALEFDEPAIGARGDSISRAPGNLDVLPLTSRTSTALWTPSALREWIDQSASRYDWVLLDGPPVLESPEASGFGAIADGVVLVVQAGRTKKPVLARSAEVLRKSGARTLGTVLNRRRLEIPGFIYRRI